MSGRKTDYYRPNKPDGRHNIHFVEECADVLLANRGEFVHLEQAVGGDCRVVAEAVNCLRHLGWRIEARGRRRAGYMLIGWDRPPRWQRLDDVYREYVNVAQLYLF